MPDETQGNERVKKLETELAEAKAKITSLEAENKKLEEKAASGSAPTEINCPACQSKVTSDGARLVKKNREFQALETLAEEADRLRTENTELRRQAAERTGGNSGNSGNKKKSLFVVG